jgi:hypothetical protein
MPLAAADVDGDGQVSKDEFAKWYQDSFARDPNDKEWTQFHDADIDGSGTVDRLEIAASLAAKEKKKLCACCCCSPKLTLEHQIAFSFSSWTRRQGSDLVEAYRQKAATAAENVRACERKMMENLKSQRILKNFLNDVDKKYGTEKTCCTRDAALKLPVLPTEESVQLFD